MATWHHAGTADLWAAAWISADALGRGVPLHLHAEGPRGTGKTTILRACAAALPAIGRVRGCPYNCDPAAPHCPLHRDLPAEAVAALGAETVPAPFVELAASAKLGTAVGTIDLGRLLDRERPEAALLPGAIARAHRGVLFVDEVNRLADVAPELTDALLDVMGTKPGRLQIEEAGVPTVALSVAVAVWAASNPDEDPGPLAETRLQLSDRFDLRAAVRPPEDAAVVLEALRGPAEGPDAAAEFAPPHCGGMRDPAWPEPLVRHMADFYLRVRLGSLRALAAWRWAAEGLARRAGRAVVAAEDVRAGARLALAGRVEERAAEDALRGLEEAARAGGGPGPSAGAMPGRPTEGGERAGGTEGAAAATGPAPGGGADDDRRPAARRIGEVRPVARPEWTGGGRARSSRRRGRPRRPVPRQAAAPTTTGGRRRGASARRARRCGPSGPVAPATRDRAGGADAATEPAPAAARTAGRRGAAGGAARLERWWRGVIEPGALTAAAADLARSRWARLGECAVASRHVHGHGDPGDPVAAVYLGLDAGRNLYGLAEDGQVLHVDVLHAPGRCDGGELRRRLLAAARSEAGDDTQRVLRWVEARVDTADEAAPGGGPGAGGPSGHVHLAFRLRRVALAFVPLAVEAAEDAILASGLDLLPLTAVEPTWESGHRPPCACGTGGAGAPAAGSGRGMRADAATTGPAGTAPEEAVASADGRSVATPVGVARPPRWRPPRASGAAVVGPRAAARPHDRPAPVRLGAFLLPVPTATAAAARGGVPLRPTPADVRRGAARRRRLDPVLVALDRSASMAERLPAVRAWAVRLRRGGRAVGLFLLPLDAGPEAACNLSPTRSPEAVAAAFGAACGAAGGESDLAGGLAALASHLRQRDPARRLLCCVVTDALATGSGDAFAAAVSAARGLGGLRGARVRFCGWRPSAARLRALARAAGARHLVLGR